MFFQKDLEAVLSGWLFYFSICFEVNPYLLPLFRVVLGIIMRKIILCWICILSVFCSCGNRTKTEVYVLADSLNNEAYQVRYKDLDLSEALAMEAFSIGQNNGELKAKALNNLGFCAFMRMDFERADSLLKEVYRETVNELECLVADVGLMKICQRTSMNKEFYDYRNSALRRMKRITEDESILSDDDFQSRYNYACSEFSITSAVYYYYLQQEKQSLEAIDEISTDKELKGDTAQLLYYYYMKGSGGMYEAETPEEIVIGEFDYLLDCLTLSHEQGYIYFEANASQAMAELLKDKEHYQLLLQKRPGMMRVINREDLSWEELILGFTQNALRLFNQYGDWYQISGTYRTLAACYMEQGRYQEALGYLAEALSYVNLHHEKYYHCHDTIDRLKPYVPMATNSIELEWINDEGIKTVPEWIARFREQLSMTYAALGMKPESDYNRNIYLDILDYTRQDKELESRYVALEEEANMLNIMLSMVIMGVILLVLLILFLNRKWRVRYGIYITKLKETLEIGKQITASVPSDAEDEEAVVEAVLTSVQTRIQTLVGANEMKIELAGMDTEEKSGVVSGVCTSLLLRNSEDKLLGVWKVYSDTSLKKDDKALLDILVSYLSWTIENGQMLVSLGDEYKRIEKEQYVHGQHLAENKRQNLVKKACLFIVTGITPYIDRIVNEVHKLISFGYLHKHDIKISKYDYLAELIARINEYNDILALWIKMRQGSLNLNVENFELNDLFEVLRKGSKNFELKQQVLLVEQTDTVLKADKALTLFMLNTLTENARKYTQVGGKVKVYAQEGEDYVEISVCDNGPGLSAQDVRHILDEKVYDSGKIGLQTATNVDELQKSKGSGFGLMNCKGIIEKYRKTNPLFRVCCFCIESTLGEGSRFYFRLPKGTRRLLGVLWIWLMPMLGACGNGKGYQETDIDTMFTDSVVYDSLLIEANRYANRVYEANLGGRYQEALNNADSALACLNKHCLMYAEQDLPVLRLIDEEVGELVWFAHHFDTDYYTLLDVRNEAAVAFLALGELKAYRYNNQAYTSLYKQISVDASLEQYCEQMQLSSNNKIVAIILCVILLIALLVGYYLMYLRHRLTYRYNLEQVLEVNKRALNIPVKNLEDEKNLAETLASGLLKEVNELFPMDMLGMAIYNEERRCLEYGFSESGEREEEMKEEMARCFDSSTQQDGVERRFKCFPLCVEAGEERQCVGVMAFLCASDVEREDDKLMLELVVNYVAIVVYNAVRLVARKFRDIELAQDEARRLQREENQLHVQNMVLDNCLSTIKHETIYYPNRIKQIVDKLQKGELTKEEEQAQVETIADLICYYKEVFSMLSSCAARQLEEITFRRGVVRAKDLEQHAVRYFKRMTKKGTLKIECLVMAEDVLMIGDVVQLKYLIENLMNEALAYTQEGKLELRLYKEGEFVRFDFIDHRREFSQEELNLLFYPHLSRMQHNGEGALVGTEYLICKQIIRDHDEYAGRRGCRMNASQVKEGGFMVWCTIPAR